MKIIFPNNGHLRSFARIRFPKWPLSVPSHGESLFKNYLALKIEKLKIKIEKLKIGNQPFFSLYSLSLFLRVLTVIPRIFAA